MSTAVVNAYLGPVMRSYIERLAGRLRELGMTATPHLTQSNGGVIGFEQAARLPVRTVLSGPSTGVVGAQAVGRLAGYPDLITFDMGGTSTDVALLQGGACRMASEAVVHGYPIKAPMLDIHTVGAGGGSIAFIDSRRTVEGRAAQRRRRSRAGLLRPRQYRADGDRRQRRAANAEPDASARRADGGAPGPGAARRSSVWRRRWGWTMLATAQGIISVVTANMARAIRVISVQRGHDPRDYTLVAFGGAGPLHAARLAKELDIGRILVPRNPGILCAMGLLLTDLRADFATTRLHTLSTAALADIAEAFRVLAGAGGCVVRRGRHRAAGAPRHPHGRHALRRPELRAVAFRCPTGRSAPRRWTPWPRALPRRISGCTASSPRASRCNSSPSASRPPGSFRRRRSSRSRTPARMPSAAIIARRDVWLPEAGGFVACPVYDRDRLRAGNRIVGPGDRRADGRDDRRAAGHGGAG